MHPVKRVRITDAGVCDWLIDLPSARPVTIQRQYRKSLEKMDNWSLVEAAKPFGVGIVHTSGAMIKIIDIDPSRDSSD